SEVWGAGSECAGDGGGAAAEDRTKRLPLLEVHARSISLQKPASLCPNDIGKLACRPGHAGFPQCRWRLASSTRASLRLSSGFTTPCRCHCERWRYLAVVSRS